MQKTVLIAVFASIVSAVICGCGSGEAKASTAEEKKGFAGGPMPADARAKFEANMKQGEQARAAAIEKAKASAMAGGNNTTPQR